MAYTASETSDSRRQTLGSRPTARFQFLVQGTAVSDPESEAIAAAVAAAPSTYNGLLRLTTNARPLLANEVYLVDITYGVNNLSGGDTTPPAVGESSWEWLRGGSSVRTFYATTETRYPVGTAPTMYAGINVTAKGVEGVDTEVPEFAWTERHYVNDADFDMAAAAAISLLKKSLNNASFRGFAAGEVFFDDFSAAKRNDDEWELTFDFRASPNVTGLAIGGITGIAKGGWDYLWVRTEKEVVGDVLVENPAAVYVNKVYPDADFSTLGIGTETLT